MAQSPFQVLTPYLNVLILPGANIFSRVGFKLTYLAIFRFSLTPHMVANYLVSLSKLTAKGEIVVTERRTGTEFSRLYQLPGGQVIAEGGTINGKGRNRSRDSNRAAPRVGDAALSTVSEISQNLQIIGVTNVASSQAMIAIPLPMER
jgi:hypothetical protein